MEKEELEFRKIVLNEIEEAFIILNDGKENLRNKGLSQWQNGFPNKKLLIKDIKKNILYGLFIKGVMVGITAISNKVDPSYLNISGAWINNNNNYYTIHTLAIKKEYLGKGFSIIIIKNAIEIAKNNKFVSIRIDTHVDNKAMIHIIEKLEFVFCGTITLIDEIFDNKRIAYEKILY